MSLILDGKLLAEETKRCLKSKVEQLKKKTKKTISLAVVYLAGENLATKIYVSKKQQAAKEVGIESLVYELKRETKQQELQEVIQGLNQDSKVNGILLQLPLSNKLQPELAVLQINPIKDVDGLHPFNLGLLMLNKPNLIPCTPYGIIKLLEKYQIELEGKKSLVIGRSFLVGKPIAQLLSNKNATVTVAHSKTPREELIQLIKESEILVCALGQANFIQADWLQENSIVIDVGINRDKNQKIVGDVDFVGAREKVRAITPVPGGVGPLTVAQLLVNTVKAFEFQNFGESLIDLELF